MNPDTEATERTQGVQGSGIPVSRPLTSRSLDPLTPSPESDSRTVVQDYLEAVARRKWLAMGVLLGVLGLAILYVVRTAPVFEAVATVMLTSSNQNDLSLDQKGYVFPTQPNPANVIELLQSRSVAESVAKRLPDPGMLSAAAVAARAVRDADIIRILVSAPSRATAVAVVNAYAEVYQQYDLNQNRADVSSTKKFIEDQLAVVKPMVDSTERALEQFKASHQLADLDATTTSLVNRQADLAVAVQQADAEIKSSEAQLAYIQSQIEQAGQGIAGKLDGTSSPLITSLQASLNQLEVEKANMMIDGFNQTSERVRNIDGKIDSTRIQLGLALKSFINQQGFVDLGQLGTQFETALTLKTGLAASSARREVLASALSRYNVQIESLPETQRILAGLTRDAETGRRVDSLLTEHYEETRIQEAGRVPSVKIVDLARSAKQTKPNVRSSLAFGLFLALVMAIGAVTAAEYLDTAIEGPGALERLGYSVLGSIPQLFTTGQRRSRRGEEVTSHLITHTDVESSGAEAFRMLRTALAFATAEHPAHIIAVTSPGPNEGKSTISVNLASVLAQAGSRVLLIDADLRHPMLHTVFKHAKKPGLSDLIVLKVSPAQAIFPTGLDGLSCLPCGTVPPSPADLLTLDATRALLERLESEYDYVVIDTPPVLVAADTPIIGTLADTSIMVVRAGRTALDALKHAGTAMLSGGAHVSGLVVNDVKRSARYGRYYYYYYKYHYRSSKHVADAKQPKEGTQDEEQPTANS